MPRQSNRGRSPVPNCDTNARVGRHGTPVDKATEAAELTGNPQPHGGTGLPAQGNGTPGQQMMHGGVVAASATEQESQRGAAPPTVTPTQGGACPRPASGARKGRGESKPAVTWTPGCGRKARTGDVVPDRQGKRQVALSGRDTHRKARCQGNVSESEARLIARKAATGEAAGARVMRYVAGGRTDNVIPLPSNDVDRRRAVKRWTLRILGRPVGIRECEKALKKLGLCL